MGWLAWLWPHLWPGWDAVWPNILASVIWAAPAWLWGRRKLRQLHARNNELVGHIRRIHDHLGIAPGAPREES